MYDDGMIYLLYRHVSKICHRHPNNLLKQLKKGYIILLISSNPRSVPVFLKLLEVSLSLLFHYYSHTLRVTMPDSLLPLFVVIIIIIILQIDLKFHLIWMKKTLLQMKQLIHLLFVLLNILVLYLYPSLKGCQVRLLPLIMLSTPPWIAKLMPPFPWYVLPLIDRSYEILQQSVAEYLCKRLETIIMKKDFTQLGKVDGPFDCGLPWYHLTPLSIHNDRWSAAG